MNRPTVQPTRIRFHSTDLACDIRRGVGFRAVCACGYRGSLKDNHAAARADARAHLCEERK